MELEQMHDTREGWLTHGLSVMGGRLNSHGYALPDKVKVACGFGPGARGGKKTAAVCIAPEASTEGITEVFISPVISDPVTALGAVLVMAGHAAGQGKGKAFKSFCTAMGLEGKAKEARPNSATEAWLRDDVLPMLGAYPHASIDLSKRDNKQGTRMIKLVCPETKDEKGNPYTVRMTKKWLDAYGAPLSPAGCEMVVEDDAGE